MSKLRSTRGGTGRFNIVSVPIYLLIIATIYLGWKYLPIYWQREKLVEITRNALIGAQHHDSRSVAGAIIEEAKIDAGLDLTFDNVKIRRSERYVEALIVYDVVVKHPFGKSTKHRMEIREKRTIIN